MNEPRHVTATISQATRGGVKALPSGTRVVDPLGKRPFFLLASSHSSLLSRGKRRPLSESSMTRRKSTAARLLTVPVSSVADAQITPQTVSPSRAPNGRSPTPMIWKMRYG